jgi:polysaccharide pyruvyl transferase WcaK-like protein
MPDAATEASVRTTRRAGPLRVALLGGFGIGNFGNDASLEAALAFLRAEYPDAQLSVICSNPAEVSGTFGVPTIATVLRPRGIWRIPNTLLLRTPAALTNWVHSFRTLKRFDVVLVPGTGIFDDFRDTPFGWPSRLLRWSLAARLSRVRLAYLSVGAGPILSPVSRVLMKWAAQQAQHRSYRDANSRDYMATLGVDESNSAVLPDVAFLLPAPPQTQRAVSEQLTVGVGIMNYSGWRKSVTVYQDYVDKHVGFIQWLFAQGYAVRALVGQTTDWITLREIEARVGRPLTSLSEAQMDSFHHVMDEVAATDLVVASRYHVQVAALQQGRPVISLSYGPKNDALLEQAGLGAFTHDIHAIDLDKLQAQVTSIAADRARYSALVRDKVSAMQARLRAALAEFDLLGV